MLPSSFSIFRVRVFNFIITRRQNNQQLIKVGWRCSRRKRCWCYIYHYSK